MDEPIIITRQSPYRRRRSGGSGFLVFLAFVLGSVATIAAGIYLVKNARTVTSVVMLLAPEKPDPLIGEYQKPILFRGCEVTALSVAIKVPEIRMSNTGGLLLYERANDADLTIDLRVRSGSKTTKPVCPRWIARLADDLGNSYAMISYGDHKLQIKGSTYDPGESLYPDDEKTQVLLFEKPIPAAKSLNLILEDNNESLTIRLPVPPLPQTTPAAPRIRVCEFRQPTLFRGVKVTAIRTSNKGYTLRNIHDNSKPYSSKVEGRSVEMKAETLSLDSKPDAPDWTAKLVDNSGRAYNRLKIGPDESPSGDNYSPGKPIHPGKPMTQILLFEKTLPDAHWLNLTLEDGGESLTFSLPVVAGDADVNQR